MATEARCLVLDLPDAAAHMSICTLFSLLSVDLWVKDASTATLNGGDTAILPQITIVPSYQTNGTYGKYKRSSAFQVALVDVDLVNMCLKESIHEKELSLCTKKK